MENFAKLLANYSFPLFSIAIVEAIIIVALVVYALKKRWKAADERKKADHLSDVLNEKIKKINELSDAYREVYNECDALRKEKKKWLCSKDVPSNHDPNRRNAKNESENTWQFNNGWDDFVKGEKGKGNHVQESTNDDGTTRSDIYFDVTSEGVDPVPDTPKIEYLEAANGGQFRKLLPSEEKCFFKTWEEKGIRKFEFHGNVEKTLANINAIFDDVCEIEGKQNGASIIINVEPGILDRNLKVEKKAKVKLV